MDAGDLILLGGAGLAAWVGYKWWQDRSTAQTSANNKSATTEMKARLASSMTAEAARTTHFGGVTSIRQIASAPAVSTSMAVRLPKPTDPAGATPETPGLRAFVRNAILGPMKYSPSPDSFRLVPSMVGSSAVESTFPRGDAPNPGDPSVVYAVRNRGIA